MRRVNYIYALMICLAANTDAFAQAPAQRPPLGPGDPLRQFPGGLQRDRMPTVASDTVAVTNFGNQALKFSAWDGTASWRLFELAPGESVSVICSRCGSAIPITFNDGSQNRTVDAKTADNYALYWDAAQNRWDFAMISEIIRSKALNR
jgi:hypothetical protein